MFDVVGDVGEKRPTGPQSLDIAERLIHRHVSWMRLESESIKNQQIEAFKISTGIVGYQVAISDVSKSADLEGSHRQPPMYDGKGLDFGAKQMEIAFNGVRDDSGDSGIRRRLECIRIYSLETFPGYLAGVAIDRAIPEHDGSGIVETETVVSVSVSEENCINTVDAIGQGLLAEVGRGVHQDVLVLELYEDRCAQPFIAGVDRPAGITFTADGRNPN